MSNLMRNLNFDNLYPYRHDQDILALSERIKHYRMITQQAREQKLQFDLEIQKLRSRLTQLDEKKNLKRDSLLSDSVNDLISSIDITRKNRLSSKMRQQPGFRFEQNGLKEAIYSEMDGFSGMNRPKKANTKIRDFGSIGVNSSQNQPELDTESLYNKNEFNPGNKAPKNPIFQQNEQGRFFDPNQPEKHNIGFPNGGLEFSFQPNYTTNDSTSRIDTKPQNHSIDEGQPKMPQILQKKLLTEEKESGSIDYEALNNAYLRTNDMNWILQNAENRSRNEYKNLKNELKMLEENSAFGRFNPKTNRFSGEPRKPNLQKIFKEDLQSDFSPETSRPGASWTPSASKSLTESPGGARVDEEGSETQFFEKDKSANFYNNNGGNRRQGPVSGEDWTDFGGGQRKRAGSGSLDPNLESKFESADTDSKINNNPSMVDRKDSMSLKGAEEVVDAADDPKIAENDSFGGVGVFVKSDEKPEFDQSPDTRRSKEAVFNLTTPKVDRFDAKKPNYEEKSEKSNFPKIGIKIVESEMVEPSVDTIGTNPTAEIPNNHPEALVEARNSKIDPTNYIKIPGSKPDKNRLIVDTNFSFQLKNSSKNSSASLQSKILGDENNAIPAKPSFRSIRNQLNGGLEDTAEASDGQGTSSILPDSLKYGGSQLGELGKDDGDEDPLKSLEDDKDDNKPNDEPEDQKKTYYIKENHENDQNEDTKNLTKNPKNEVSEENQLPEETQPPIETNPSQPQPKIIIKNENTKPKLETIKSKQEEEDERAAEDTSNTNFGELTSGHTESLKPSLGTAEGSNIFDRIKEQKSVDSDAIEVDNIHTPTNQLGSSGDINLDSLELGDIQLEADKAKNHDKSLDNQFVDDFEDVESLGSEEDIDLKVEDAVVDPEEPQGSHSRETGSGNAEMIYSKEYQNVLNPVKKSLKINAEKIIFEFNENQASGGIHNTNLSSKEKDQFFSASRSKAEKDDEQVTAFFLTENPSNQKNPNQGQNGHLKPPKPTNLLNSLASHSRRSSTTYGNKLRDDGEEFNQENEKNSIPIVDWNNESIIYQQRKSGSKLSENDRNRGLDAFSNGISDRNKKALSFKFSKLSRISKGSNDFIASDYNSVVAARSRLSKDLTPILENDDFVKKDIVKHFGFAGSGMSFWKQQKQGPKGPANPKRQAKPPGRLLRRKNSQKSQKAEKLGKLSRARLARLNESKKAQSKQNGSQGSSGRLGILRKKDLAKANRLNQRRLIKEIENIKQREMSQIKFKRKTKQMITRFDDFFSTLGAGGAGKDFRVRSISQSRDGSLRAGAQPRRSLGAYSRGSLKGDLAGEPRRSKSSFRVSRKSSKRFSSRGSALGRGKESNRSSVRGSRRGSFGSSKKLSLGENQPFGESGVDKSERESKKGGDQADEGLKSVDVGFEDISVDSKLESLGGKGGDKRLDSKPDSDVEEGVGGLDDGGEAGGISLGDLGDLDVEEGGKSQVDEAESDQERNRGNDGDDGNDDDSEIPDEVQEDSDNGGDDLDDFEVEDIEDDENQSEKTSQLESKEELPPDNDESDHEESKQIGEVAPGSGLTSLNNLSEGQIDLADEVDPPQKVKENEEHSDPNQNQKMESLGSVEDIEVPPKQAAQEPPKNVSQQKIGLVGKGEKKSTEQLNEESMPDNLDDWPDLDDDDF